MQRSNLPEEEVVVAQPSPESLVKLSKLEPLPPLLADFDLDAHVGLIQRLLEVNEQLVEQQSNCLVRRWMFLWRITKLVMVLLTKRHTFTMLCRRQ